MVAIEVKYLSKKFKLFRSNKSKLLEFISLGKIRGHNDFWALKDISFKVPRGSTFGIIGQNGSGKSTLLSILAGVLEPTDGRLIVNGNISAILELGSGFHPDFTGRQNIYMYASIIGLPKKQIDARLDEIVHFSELADFIDHPLRTYSSGMIIRLAFSVAVNVDCDILLVDEALAVGDILFQHRCFKKIREMKEEGKTILYVGHDMEVIRNICNNALLLDKGKIIEIDNPDTVTNKYLALIKKRENEYYESASNDLCKNICNSVDMIDTKTGLRFGTKEAEIIKVEMLDKNDSPKNIFKSGEESKIRIHCKINQHIDDGFNVGFIIRNKFVDVYHTNAYWLGHKLGKKEKGSFITIDFIQNLYLAKGFHHLTVACGTSFSFNDSTILDWINDILTFEIATDKLFLGLADLNSRIVVRS